VKEIPLTRGFVALVDDEDYEAVSQFKWFLTAYGRYTTKDSKMVNRVRGKRMYMHRFLWNRWGFPSAPQLDHVNGDGLDNRKCNLRPATVSQNMSNSAFRSHNTSGYRGVSEHNKGSWQAYVRIGKKKKHLGLFCSAESAARVYDAWAKEAYQDFARLNFA
jgi:hypothetical protein